jgi:plastocyanin
MAERTVTGRLGIGRGIGGLFLLFLCAAAPLTAQPTTERTPNLTGSWVTSPQNLHFLFSHRFEVVGQDADVSDIFGDGVVVNYPTFDVAYGLFSGAMAGVRYSSNSRIAGGANEWQPYLKLAPLRGTGEGELAAAATLAWNGGTQSVDGELAVQSRLGRFLLLGAARGFTDAFDLPADRDDEALALAAGAGFRLTRYLTLAADVADLVAGPEAPASWSAGLQIGIPATPHTLSLMATNVSSGTLEGVSTGDRDDVYWGFEFTVPFSGFARWGSIFDPEVEAAEESADGPAGRVVEIEVTDLAFGTEELRVPAGTTVRWVNRDPVAHTATADDGTWGSPLVGPGETFTRTFGEPGRHPYHCSPHPFMEGVIIVTE